MLCQRSTPELLPGKPIGRFSKYLPIKQTEVSELRPFRKFSNQGSTTQNDHIKEEFDIC